MNLSAKVEYAAVAVLELANHYGSQDPVRLRSIAEAHGIPSSFLVQIMLQLKAAGLVESTRGAAGGYSLTRDPAEITLGDVKQIIDGSSAEITSSMSSPGDASRVLLDAWQEVEAAQWEMLHRITFAELVDRCRGTAEKMYYI